MTYETVMEKRLGRLGMNVERTIFLVGLFVFLASIVFKKPEAATLAIGIMGANVARTIFSGGTR